MAEGKAEFLGKRESYFNELYAKQQDKLKELTFREIEIKLPDGTIKKGECFKTTPYDIAFGISKGLAKDIVGAKVIYSKKDNGLFSNIIQADEHDEMENGGEVAAEAEIIDVTRPFEGDCTLEL